MTKKNGQEGEGRIPKFEGCRSYTYRAETGGKIWTGGRCSLATAMYNAGRIVEMARTDGIAAKVTIFDHLGRNIGESGTNGGSL